VGRSEELQTLEVFLGTARLCTEQAIVVISGIGGIGKSELALQVAARTREMQVHPKLH
jgi:predicted ATP-dependent serine protease